MCRKRKAHHRVRKRYIRQKSVMDAAAGRTSDHKAADVERRDIVFQPHSHVFHPRRWQQMREAELLRVARHLSRAPPSAVATARHCRLRSSEVARRVETQRRGPRATDADEEPRRVAHTK